DKQIQVVVGNQTGRTPNPPTTDEGAGVNNPPTTDEGAGLNNPPTTEAGQADTSNQKSTPGSSNKGMSNKDNEKIHNPGHQNPNKAQ
ncbi:MAG: hypothetical protein PHY94_08615, partial [Candidatus Omnitrophica bacterium]|nr:hypothetical protein [Candidatus Omnitrophota bacterium]